MPVIVFFRHCFYYQGVSVRFMLFLLLALANTALVAAPATVVPDAVKQALANELNFFQLSGIAIDGVKFMPEKSEPELKEPDMYNAHVGSYVFQISADGGFAFRSNYIDTEAGQALSREAKEHMRKGVVQALNPEGAIVFPAQKNQKHVLTVFTDASCPFCAKFHQELHALNQAGVTVRYLVFPREGLQTPGHATNISVWCSENPHEAIEEAMSGFDILSAECNNPVEAFFYLGESLGVDGTPTLLFEDGSMRVGYFPATAVLGHLSGRQRLPDMQ